MVRGILYVTLQSEHLLPHVASDVIVISHCLNDFFFVVPLEDGRKMKITSDDLPSLFQKFVGEALKMQFLNFCQQHLS